MAATLNEWKGSKVCVLTCDGRMVSGILAGHDQVQNLILQDAIEQLYSLDQPVEEVPLGLYVVRGDNLALVSQIENEDGQQQIFYQGTVPQLIPPVRQVQF